jgi:phospholipid/cholesterol/gamma-HCH transport system substrate-binding protein
MYNHAYALVTGAFLVLLTAGALLVAWWLAGADSQSRPYVVVTEGSVTGLGEGSQVFFRGVRAGRVELININPKAPSEILISISVGADIPVTRGTYATLQLSGLTGLTQVELDDTREDLTPLPTSAEAPGRILMQPGLFDRFVASGPELLANINELTLRLNALFDQDNRERVGNILDRADRLLGAMDRLSVQLEREIGRTGDAVAGSLEAVEGLISEAGGALGKVDGMMAGVDGVLAELREVAASGRRLTDELGAQALPGLESLIGQLEASGRELGRLARELRQRPESAVFGRPRPPPGPGEEDFAP